MGELLRDWDYLLHRYLEGTIAGDEAAALNARLKEDSALARRLADMSVDALQLRDLGAGDIMEPVQGDSIPAPRPAWPRGPIAAAAAILLAVLVAVVARSMGPAPSGSGQEASAPETRVDTEEVSWIDAIDGFEGRVTGRIVKGDNRKVELRVLQFSPSVENERAEKALVGRRIQLVPATDRDDEGDPRPDPVHQAFLRRLQDSEEVTVEIVHSKGGVFRLGKLDRIYADWAKGSLRGENPPREGARESDERPRREEGERPRDRREGEVERGERRREGDRNPEERENERRIRRDGDPEERGESRGDFRREREQGDREGRSNREDR